MRAGRAAGVLAAAGISSGHQHHAAWQSGSPGPALHAARGQQLHRCMHVQRRCRPCWTHGCGPATAGAALAEYAGHPRMESGKECSFCTIPTKSVKEQWGHSAAYGKAQLFFNSRISSACPSFWTTRCRTILVEPSNENEGCVDSNN